VLHSMVRSILWIFADNRPGVCREPPGESSFQARRPEKKHLLTLRGVIRFSLQAVGVLAIVFVILGVPNRCQPSWD